MFQSARTALAVCLVLLMGSPPSLAQDQAAVVDGLTVARGEAPLPLVGRGAANYSPEQTASYLCGDEGEARGFIGGLIPQAAHSATLKAREVRQRAFRGEATPKEMEEAELARQRAVGRLGSSGLAQNFPGPGAKGLSIEAVSRRRVLENGRAVLLVTGKVRNTTQAEIELPPMSVQTVDVRGFVLAGQTSQLDQIRIGAGEVQDFTFRFKNPPHYTTEVKVHFAPPFGLRNFRGCDFFDPMNFDPNQTRVRAERAAVTPIPVPKVGEGAPAYTPKELAAMVRRARYDAETSFNNRNSNSTCAPMQPWRSLLVMADQMEEAWIATNAAEEARRDAARGVFTLEEAGAAELSRQAAVKAFIAARPAPRQPAPADYPGVSIGGVERDGKDSLVVRATYGNAGKERAGKPPLLVTVVDRYGFVLTETLQRPGGQIAPGKTDGFSVSIGLPPSLIGEARVEIAC